MKPSKGDTCVARISWAAGGRDKSRPYMLVLALLALVNSVGFAADARRPNLLVVMTDDQAHWSTGSFGNTDSRTPNMDRRAREGATFTNAFVNTPVCSPSRATFFTGRHGTQLGITD